MTSFVRSIITALGNTRIITLALLLVTGSNAVADDLIQVRITTTMGVITLELNRGEAPITVVNFLRYMHEGFYDKTLFHRVIDGFMIQGGGFRPTFVRKPTRKEIRNEAHNGLQNLRGTIAMARTSAPHSASSQFFINLVDNGFLDFTAKTPKGWGYTVFGRVVDGMDVVDRIAKTPTGNQSGYQNVPLKPVQIESMSLIPAT